MNFQYMILRSANGMVGSANGPIPLAQALNFLGQHGGEVVSAVSDGPGTIIVFRKACC
jgi:hypothetical protein